jgi:hypothetical protein
MYPAKRPQKVAQARPQTLDGVDVYLFYPVPVIIAGSLLYAVANRLMLPLYLLVGTPLFGVGC